MAQDKQIIDGYEELHSIRLDSVDHIVAINASATPPYRVYECRRDNPLGVDEYRTIFEDRDYLKTMRELVRRLGSRLDTLELGRVYRGSPLLDPPILKEDCAAGGMDADLTGKVIAIRQEVLSPEYRSLSHQAHLATGGFGCSPTASGRAVYCTNLYSGEQERFERGDVLGVIAEDSGILPDWAHQKLDALRQPPEKESVIAKIWAAKAQPPQERKSFVNRKSQEPEL